MPENFVYIRRSGDDASVQPGYVSREAFDSIWKGKGFAIVDDDEAALASSEPTRAEIQAGQPESKSTTKKGS